MGYYNASTKYDRIVVFDTETTGLSPESCQIIELAMLIMDRAGTTNYNELIKLPEGEHLPKEIVELTHITDEMLADGIPEKTAARDIFDTLSGGRVLMIAHNCQFDMNFLLETLRRYYGSAAAEQLVNSCDWIDTLTVYRDRAAYPNKLANAIEHYHLSDRFANSHRAIDDCNALAAVYLAMKHERDDIDCYINVFGYYRKYGVSGIRLSKITYAPQDFHDWMTSPDEILPRVI